jgi:endonuclease/exonuclease/phosphatase family metal-dependent hydrolase
MYDQKLITLSDLGITYGPILTELKDHSVKSLGKYVGKLQELWQFPSDHLPIGLNLDEITIASWNVFDAKHMRWIIDKDAQGLKKSLIVNEHIYIEQSGLTIRDKRVAQVIHSLLRDIVALQEISKPLLIELTSILPSNFIILSHGSNALIFNQELFELVEAHAITNIFATETDRSFQNIILERRIDAKKFRLINVHIPGDPSKPSRFEFGNYLIDTFDPELTTLALGDMNFNELKMREAIPTKRFTILSPYCTNIEPRTFMSKAIDHFIVHPESSDTKIETLSPNNLLFGLQTLVDLLH